MRRIRVVTFRRAIAWFRRDLRMRDNRMLAAATAEAERVWPVFIADRTVLQRTASATGRQAWYAASVSALDHGLRRQGSGLLVVEGDPVEELPRLARRFGAEAIFAGFDEEPAARDRDDALAAKLPLRLVDDQRIVPPGTLRTAQGGAYRVFSAYRRALNERLAAEPTGMTAVAEPDLARLAPPEGSQARLPMGDPPVPLPHAGEEAGMDRLRAFVRHDLRDYAADRDRPDRNVTSRLSPYLRVGAVSIRAAWRIALAAEERARERNDSRLHVAVRRWRDELAWREFFAAILHAHPEVVERGFRTQFDAVEWETGRAADEALAAWSSGMTGFPIVDAGMRQLAATGWMHNRLRLITADFLVKDLGIDWRRGESVFMQHLLDGDTAQNNGNWQWVAGVGTDAAPNLRAPNPPIQARRFDPQGSFVRRWVPEVAALPTERIHEPWLADAPPRDYPAPIVDHGAARLRALQRYRARRSVRQP